MSKGNDHPGPSRYGDTVHVYMGTIYQVGVRSTVNVCKTEIQLIMQLFNFSKKNFLQVDGVIVDEAGQISLGSISLVLRCLSNQGRIVVAGDSEQLSPILSAQYPLLKAHALFGSVLDCLMLPRASPLKEHLSSFEESQGAIPTAPPDAIIQLTENFRYESLRSHHTLY